LDDLLFSYYQFKISSGPQNTDYAGKSILITGKVCSGSQSVC